MNVLITLLSFVIRIATQGDFDRMGQDLIQMVRSGEKDITVHIHPGVYFFREDHLDLSQVNEPSVSLTLEGDGVTILSEGGTPRALTPQQG